jgi:D-alanyl-lipoteichoic acid acyltransferase DltB (MBOAT superfamily)
MMFFSLRFIIFVIAALLLYYAVPRRFQWVVLLAASYVFYLAGGWNTVFYIVFTTAVTYTAGRLLTVIKYKRLIVAAALLTCFGMLYVLRYWNFTLELLTNSDRFALHLLIPLGVSFFIFQSAGYVIDVYRGKYEPEKNPFRFALFVSFFPQIIQGPISRFHDLGQQLAAGAGLDFTHIKHGVQLAMWGYFKKLVIADRAAAAVNQIFTEINTHDGAIVAFAVFFYCIQLYCDFSGGIDITRGVAKMFGINLAENFRRPLFSTSLADFWRRWHITLGAWLKDYLFYSMALSRPIVRIGKFTRSKIGGTLGKVIPTSICTFIVYIVIGIWHGANFRWIAFGFWNGAIITSSLLLGGFFTACKKKLRINDKSRVWWAFSVMRTMLIVFLGRYITRAPRLTYTFAMLRNTVTNFRAASFFDGSLFQFIGRFDLLVVVVAVMAMVLLEYKQEQGVQVRAALEKRGFLVQWGAIFIPLAAILVLGVWGYAEYFIYMQF